MSDENDFQKLRLYFLRKVLPKNQDFCNFNFLNIKICDYSNIFLFYNTEFAFIKYPKKSATKMNQTQHSYQARARYTAPQRSITKDLSDKRQQSNTRSNYSNAKNLRISI